MKKIVIITLIGLVTWACEEGPLTVDGPAGSAHYYLKNETDQGLIIAFETSWELGNRLDSGQVLTSGDSVLILEDGIIGVNPVPTNSFTWIRLYTQDSELSYYTLDPVDNDSWAIVGRENFKGGYGRTIYTLSIPDSY